jgi:hypothetical protein
MKLLLNLLLLTSSLALTACSQISSSDVDADSIYGELGLTQTEGSNQGTVSATFFVGGGTGTVVQLASPAGVTVNGQRAAEITDPILNMTSYVGNTSGNATVIYTDKDGKTYTNTLAAPGTFSISLPSNTAFISQGLNINYTSASAFTSGDELQISLGSSFGGGGFIKSLTAGANSGSTSLNSSDLSGLQPGPYTLKVCRQSTPSAQAPFPKGTTISIQSCANPKNITLQR